MKSQEFFTITSYEKIKVNKIRVLEKNFEKKIISFKNCLSLYTKLKNHKKLNLIFFSFFHVPKQIKFLQNY